MSIGENDDEIIISTEKGDVYRRCISTNCARTKDGVHVDRDALMLRGGGLGSLQGLATIRSQGVYLLATNNLFDKSSCVFNLYGTGRVLRCSLFELSDVGDCSLFTDTVVNPISVVVDVEKSLVYISDSHLDSIRIFSFDGGSALGRLETHSGSLSKVTSFQLRPGFFAPNSDFTLPPAFEHFAKAGELLTFGLILKDAYNRNLPSTTLLSRRLAITASGSGTLTDGSAVPLRLRGEVVEKAGEVSAKIGITTSGNWTVSIREELVAVPTHFFGSPFLITIGPDETDPTYCKVVTEKMTFIGKAAEFFISTYDKFGNPTQFESDKFKGFIENDKSATEQTLQRIWSPDRAKYEFKFSLAFDRAGLYLVRLQDEKTGIDVANSPFSVTVVLTAEQQERADRNANILDTKTLLIVLGASGVTLFCAIWAVNRLRRFMRKKFVAASKNSIRELVQSNLLCVFDVVVDIFQFRSNLLACEAQKLWVTLAFGSGFLASAAEIGIGLYCLFDVIVVGRVYINDDMSAIYDSMSIAIETTGISKKMFTGISIVRSKTILVLSGIAKKTSWISGRATKIAPTHSSSSAPKESYAFGSNEEFVELVKQRNKYEDEMAQTRRGVYMAFGGLLTALFEDLLQIIVNSYRVVTGCGNDVATTFGSTLSDDNYTWTKADSFMFFNSLKTVFFFSIKLRHFYSVIAKRDRMHELRKLIKEKTEECKANRFMHAMLAEAAPRVPSEQPKDNMVVRGSARLDGNLGQPDYSTSSVSSTNTSQKVGAEETNVSQSVNKKMAAQIVEMLQKISALEKGQGNALDEKTFKRFIDVTMHSVPAVTPDELELRDKALEYSSDKTHSSWKFETIKGASKSNPTVKMFASKGNTDNIVWGKCVGEVDEAPEVVLAFVWHMTSLERLSIHEKRSGNLLRVSDMSEKSRSQIFKCEFVLGLGVRNRRGIGKYTWFELEPGNPSGREGYCVVWESCVSSKDHVEEGFTRNSVEARSKGIYLIEKIEQGRTKFTMVQQATMGGNIPHLVINWMIPRFLSLVVVVQERYKKDKKDKEVGW